VGSEEAFLNGRRLKRSRGDFEQEESLTTTADAASVNRFYPLSKFGTLNMKRLLHLFVEQRF
jgi:hypothetical protein